MDSTILSSFYNRLKQARVASLRMDQPTSEMGLSPLDQIRQAEADMNRRIAAARQAAEQIIAEAEQQALELKRQAREDGVQEGMAGYRATMAAAEEEARAIAAEAREHTQELRCRGQRLLGRGVRFAIGVVIDLPEDESHT